MRRSRKARAKPPLEYSILYTATLCLLAVGSVMVYSASSAEALLDGSGDPSYFFKRYLVFGLIGLAALHLASRHGVDVAKRITGPLLGLAFALTLAVELPGIGVSVNRATRRVAPRPGPVPPAGLPQGGLVLHR